MRPFELNINAWDSSPGMWYDSFDTVTADRLSPLVRRLLEPGINRRIENNITRADPKVVSVTARVVWGDIDVRPS